MDLRLRVRIRFQFRWIFESEWESEVEYPWIYPRVIPAGEIPETYMSAKNEDQTNTKLILARIFEAIVEQFSFKIVVNSACKQIRRTLARRRSP